MNKRIILLIIFIFILVLSMEGYSYATDVELNDSNILIDNEEENSKLGNFIEQQMKKGKIPGLAVAVIKDDKTIYQNGFGYSDIKSGKRVTSESLFELGSNSKAFTALGILKLEEEGKINRKDQISKYIPWLQLIYKGQEVPVTVGDFVYHTSGIPFNSIDKIPESDSSNAIEKTVRTLEGTELSSQPGTAFEYATINYDVLGYLIETITGRSYEEYMENEILKPMGLNNTYMELADIERVNMTKGYKIGYLKSLEYEAPTYKGNKPAGYIVSNISDIASWLKIQMGVKELSGINNDLILKSHMPNRRVPPMEDKSSYAGGWFVYQEGGGVITHGGNNPNYSSFIILKPEEQLGIAVLCNLNTQCTEEIAYGIAGILEGKEIKHSVKDLNKSADYIAMAIIVSTIMIIIATFYNILRTLLQIVKKERTLNLGNLRGFFKTVLSFFLILVICYSVYLIPYILYNGVSWNFVFVWLPITIKIALYLIYISIWMVYFYALLTNLFSNNKDKSILLLVILSIISGFGNALIIFTINIGIGSSNQMKIKLLIYFILGIVLYVYGQKIVRSKLITVTNDTIYSKRIEIIKKLLSSPLEKFEDIEPGRIESTLNNDTETISRFVNILISAVTSAVTLMCCFIYLGFINRYVLLLSLLVILLISSIYFLVGRYANRIGEQARDLQNIFFKFINDLIGGFKELKLNRERRDEFNQEMEESCSKYRFKRGQAALAFANMFVVGELLFTLAIGAIALIFPLILKNLETTSISSYVFILLYMTGPVHAILDVIPDYIEVRISLDRINQFTKELSEQSMPEIELSQSKELNIINLKLDEIEYSYNKKDNKSFIVGPITYEFNSGEIIFITGGNGSGKSTLAKLLTGLYNLAKGTITINNKKVSVNELSENFSTIFSDFYLFDKLYGINYEGNEDKIQNYLELLHLEKKVEIVNGIFSTTKLSTGQKKRLALLVAYLEDRPIYLFDEWAADQDPEFRLFFYKILLPDLKERGKCVIAITHDDHYFNMADKIIKMEMGKCI
jgi:putative pyoverdin transport system ATP-binding/permease protein